VSPGTFKLHFILRNFVFPGRITWGNAEIQQQIPSAMHRFLKVPGEINLFFAYVSVKEEESCRRKKKMDF